MRRRNEKRNEEKELGGWYITGRMNSGNKILWGFKQEENRLSWIAIPQVVLSVGAEGEITCVT